MSDIFLAIAWRLDVWAGWLALPMAGTSRYTVCAAVFAIAALCPPLRAWALQSSAVARLSRGAALATPAIAAACLAAAWGYTTTPAFIDHVEPQIAAVSWLYAAGEPIWHEPGAAPYYALPYGPLTYEIVATSLSAFGPSIAAAKLAGPAAATATLVLLWSAIRRSGHDAITALAASGALVLVLFQFGIAAYWNRPDPLIVLLLAVALWSRGRGLPALRWVLIGAVAGGLFTLKIHAAAYILPIAAAELASARARVGAAATMAAAGAAVLALAFTRDGVDPLAFLSMMQIAMRHGASLDNVLLNASYVAVWLVPFCWFAWRRWEALHVADRVAAATLVAVTLAVLYPASKHGAGPWHLMPLAPVAACLALEGMRRAGPAATLADRSRAVCACALVVGAFSLPMTAVAQVLAVRDMIDDERAEAAHDEVIAAMDRHPGRALAVGYAGGPRYWFSFVRPLAVFRGNAYQFDAAALMDFAFAGLELQHPAVDSIARCEIDVWLIPSAAAPFVLESVYDSRPVFSDAFVAAFRSSYRLDARGATFDTWVCARS